MDILTCSPFELAELVVYNNNKSLMDRFPDLSFDFEQQEQLATYLVMGGLVRRVIKCRRCFTAVRGKFDFNHEIEDSDLLDFKPGFYVTDSTSLDIDSRHPHLYDHDGNVLTVVEVTDYKNLPYDTFNRVEEVVNLGYVVEGGASEGMKLYLNDVDKFLGVKTTYTSRVSDLRSKSVDGLGSLLNMLQEQVGANSYPEAIEVAIALGKEQDKETAYQEQSPFYAALKSELRKAALWGTDTKNLNELEAQIKRTYPDLKSRQPRVIAQTLIEIT
ncbi:hypothetical protein ACEQ2R_003350 [Vibrio parahaemolyticus]|uniref:hypothetical protein n=1 Tax=Vibrio parahaemolyticus TaxID=670 RepID=UPI0003FF4B0A|nr:hypothetical protein [Vibrio parahaemolyticus]EGR3455231.1 hypothetical protein [Vibrio parahaemolyticus]ELA7933310.1 hypothetical protein [Vibrio parahaemolyticus]MQC29988.1 hypothetical protein [Vibrio parahaemolyticus]WJE03086.1 hypothetical protein QRT07_10975 [Vibrio parahaemolyticus]